jgi:hypothetical protein
MSFTLHRLSVKSNFNADYRPSFHLSGTFGNSALTLEDRGSIAAAFLADGAVAGEHQLRQSTPPLENVTVRLEETGELTAPACPQLR